MMYTATAVDFQFYRYMAKKQAIELRNRQRTAGIRAQDSHCPEIGPETQKSESNGKKSDPLDCGSCEAQPDVRNNPPRAGPEAIIKNERKRRRRCL